MRLNNPELRDKFQGIGIDLDPESPQFLTDILHQTTTLLAELPGGIELEMVWCGADAGESTPVARMLIKDNEVAVEKIDPIVYAHAIAPAYNPQLLAHGQDPSLLVLTKSMNISYMPMLRFVIESITNGMPDLLRSPDGNFDVPAEFQERFMESVPPQHKILFEELLDYHTEHSTEKIEVVRDLLQMYIVVVLTGCASAINVMYRAYDNLDVMLIPVMLESMSEIPLEHRLETYYRAQIAKLGLAADLRNLKSDNKDFAQLFQLVLTASHELQRLLMAPTHYQLILRGVSI